MPSCGLQNPHPWPIQYHSKPGRFFFSLSHTGSAALSLKVFKFLHCLLNTGLMLTRGHEKTKDLIAVKSGKAGKRPLYKTL